MNNRILQKPIVIQEISVLGDSGEADLSDNKEKYHIVAKNDYQDDAIVRIKKYIEQVVEIAQLKHIAALKKTNNNQVELVTRLSMDEFSLYTKNIPLTFKNYQEIIDHCFLLAKTLPENIHLIIGTMPIVWPDGKMRNCALYIQSPNVKGWAPKIYHFSKKYKAREDYTYNKKFLLEAYPVGGPDESESANMLKLQYLTIDHNQYLGAIKLVTASGGSLMTTCEICLDHRHLVAVRNLIKLIEQLKLRKQTVPLFINQVLISNHYAVCKNNFRASVTHIDHLAKKTDKFNPSEKFNLYQPAFGKKTTIKVYSPRRVGIAYGEIMIKIFSGKNKLKQKRILDAQDGEGKTMLQYVVEDFRNELAIPRVKSLLESGASYEIKNYSGESVMSMLRCLKAEIAPGSLDDKKLVLMQKEIVTFIVRKYLKQPETPSTLSQANIFSQKNISKPIEKNHARSNTRHV